MRHVRKIIRVWAALALLFTTLPVPCRADMIVGSGEIRRLFLTPGPAHAPAPAPTAPAAAEEGTVTKVEVVRIIPRQGNNPFNTVDPINNTTINGQVIQQAVDQGGHTPGGDHGGGDPGGGSAIVCNVGAGALGMNSEVLSFRLDYSPGSCSVSVQGGAAGTYAQDYVFDIGNPPVGLNQSGLLWFRSSLGAGRYSIISLSPGAAATMGEFRYLTPGSYTVRFKNNSDAKEWLTKITVAGSGSGSIRNFASISLTINSVQQP